MMKVSACGKACQKKKMTEKIRKRRRFQLKQDIWKFRPEGTLPSSFVAKSLATTDGLTSARSKVVCSPHDAELPCKSTECQ